MTLQGCDGSVLVQGNGAESSDPANKSLDGFYVVESAKRLLEIWCPGTVSCADILVLAARDAVELVFCSNIVFNFHFFFKEIELLLFLSLYIYMIVENCIVRRPFGRGSIRKKRWSYFISFRCETKHGGHHLFLRPNDATLHLEGIVDR